MWDGFQPQNQMPWLIAASTKIYPFVTWALCKTIRFNLTHLK